MAFGLRVAALGIPASAWWAGPVLVQTLYGIDFLQFTEQPGAIWASTSLSESFRLMGYWPSYLGVGYGSLLPFYETSPDLLFSAPVVVATLLVPALAVAGFALARRWAYGPFFLGLLLLGLLVMTAGFPEGTPMRKGVTFVYNTFSPVQFLRTTHKAGPLVVLALACLAGAGGAGLLRGRGRGVVAAAAVAGLVLVAVSVFPLTRGKAVDGQLTYDHVPAAWEKTADDLDRDLGDNSRALILPGQLLAYYRWGQTVDAVLPALTDRPVAIRQFVPRADLHSSELLIAVDALVQQERLVPGQLQPLLRLLGVRQVVSATDDASGSGAMPAADAARQLRGQGLGRPEAGYGRKRSFRGADGGFAAAERLPEVRRHRVAGTRGIVRVEPAGPATLVDGAADGLTALAAFGALPRDRPLAYAADRDARTLRRDARAGAELVVTDSNRRRVFVPARLRQNTGATLAAGDPISEDSALLNPFPDRGAAAQTVARVTGARYVRAPFSPQFPQLPENRPAAAFDGSPRTEWLGDTHLDAERRWVEVGFRGRRDVPYVDVLPAGGRSTTVSAVEIAGRRYPVEPGWNRIRVGLRDVPNLRLLLRNDTDPRYLRQGNGLAEVRIPGLEVREQLRPPTLLQSALRGTDLDRSALTYLFTRTSGDRPFRRDSGRRAVRNGRPVAFQDPEARSTRDAVDGETDMDRRLDPPAARAYRTDAWTSVSPDAPDSRIDRLAGVRGGARFDSTGRFQGLARHRASAAFDRDPGTAWVADRLDAGRPALRWRTARPERIRRLRLTASGLPAATPTRVRVSADGRSSPVVPVGRDGRIDLPRALTGRSFRLQVVRASRQRGPRGDTPPTVAIARLAGPGVPVAPAARPGPLASRCGDAAVRTAAGTIPLRVSGTTADLEAGRPLRARGCGPARRLPAGGQDLTTREGVVRVDHLRLRSPAPAGAAATRGGGAVVDAGTTSRGRHEGVRVVTAGPSWLVLGESFNRGWRASCDGDDLGEPEVVDGYANGWRAPAGCRDVTMAFGPQRALNIGFLFSAVVCAVLLVFLLLTRRRRAPEAGDAGAVAADAPPVAWRLPHRGGRGPGGGAGLRIPVRPAHRSRRRAAGGAGALARGGLAPAAGGRRGAAGRGPAGGLRGVPTGGPGGLQLRLRRHAGGSALGGRGGLRAAGARAGAVAAAQ